MTTQEKPHLKPSSNKLQISSDKDVNFYSFLAKIFLKEQNEIELHALGQAISNSVRVAETLERYGFVKIVKIDQFTHQYKEENNKDPKGKKVKMVIHLQKTTEFDSKTQNIKV